MKINISVLDIDVDTKVGNYELFFFNFYSSEMDKSVLHVGYNVALGFTLGVLGFKLL